MQGDALQSPVSELWRCKPTLVVEHCSRYFFQNLRCECVCVCVLTLLVFIIQLCLYVKAVQLADLLLLLQARENESRTLLYSRVLQG